MLSTRHYPQQETPLRNSLSRLKGIREPTGMDIVGTLELLLRDMRPAPPLPLPPWDGYVPLDYPDAGTPAD